MRRLPTAIALAAMAVAGASFASAEPGDPPKPAPSWYPDPGPLQFTPCTADQVLKAVEEVAPDVWASLNSADQREGKGVIQARNWLTMYLHNQPGDREVKSNAPNQHQYRPYWINDVGNRMNAVTAACGKYPTGGRGR
jgi:hypothetical protein